MRSIAAASFVFLAVIALALSGLSSTTRAEQTSRSGLGGGRLIDGQAIFRFDTFGDEQLWTDTLRMQKSLKPSIRRQLLRSG